MPWPEAVAHTSGAVGYIASGFIGDHQNMVVSYNGVQPTPDNIRNHLYSFSTDEHLYTWKNADAGITAFVQYVKGDASVLKENGVF